MTPTIRDYYLDKQRQRGFWDYRIAHAMSYGATRAELEKFFRRRDSAADACGVLCEALAACGAPVEDSDWLAAYNSGHRAGRMLYGNYAPYRDLPSLAA